MVYSNLKRRYFHQCSLQSNVTKLLFYILASLFTLFFIYQNKLSLYICSLNPWCNSIFFFRLSTGIFLSFYFAYYLLHWNIPKLNSCVFKLEANFLPQEIYRVLNEMKANLHKEISKESWRLPSFHLIQFPLRSSASHFRLVHPFLKTCMLIFSTAQVPLLSCVRLFSDILPLLFTPSFFPHPCVISTTFFRTAIFQRHNRTFALDFKDILKLAPTREFRKQAANEWKKRQMRRTKVSDSGNCGNGMKHDPGNFLHYQVYVMANAAMNELAFVRLKSAVMDVLRRSTEIRRR